MKTTPLSFSILILSLSIFGNFPSAYAKDIDVLPIGWLDSNISNKVINQASQPESSAQSIRFVGDDPRAGYREVQSFGLDLKAGIYGGWSLSDGGFPQDWFGAGPAIVPVVGSTVVSNRWIQNPSETDKLSFHKIPSVAEGLDSWKPHDSIFYDVRGGLIFAVGIGYAFTGVSGDYYAQGDWTTYIEKLDAKKVFVKITNTSLSDFDMMVGNYAVSEILSAFNKSDAMFSYIFDLSDPRAVSAYEAMIHGSMKEAENLYKIDPAVSQLDLTETGATSGNQSRFSVGFPFLNYTNTSGTLENYSKTVFHQDNSKSDVQYGLSWSQSDTHVFAEQRSHSRSFYGIAYTTTRADGSKENKKNGRLILSYENNRSDDSSVADMLSDLVRQTGLRQQLTVTGSLPSGDLGYTHLTLIEDFSEAATQQMMNRSSQLLTRFSSAKFVGNYFDRLHDPEGLCDPHRQVQSIQACQAMYERKTQEAVTEMAQALGQMTQAQSAQDSKAFSLAYARFGRAMLENEFTFAIANELSKGAPVDITFSSEGTRLSQMRTHLPLGIRSFGGIDLY